MECKTYYGEYSLDYWIELMLSRNIILPQYQRSFVWKEDNVQRLIKSLNNRQFVQPVTIALKKINRDVNGRNLILDGQQRLTTILLSKIGYMPDIDKFEKVEDLEEGDEADEGEEVPNHNKSIKWTFSQMLSDNPRENTILKIRERVKADGRYNELKLPVLTDMFFKNTFLGFSYIVPDTNKQEEVVESFAQLFRNINYFGMHLSALESRRSLYYMNPEYHKFFEGIDSEGNDVLCDMRIIEKMQSSKLDFVRYLAALSQYYPNENPKEVMKWYSSISSRESYYADYVSYLLGLDQEDYKHKFDKFVFKEVFANNDIWKERYRVLRNCIERLMPMMELKNEISFTSLINADYWLYGLIYHIVFKGKTLNDEIQELCDELKAKINPKIEDKEGYAKAPNKLGLLRDRIVESVNIYSNYVH